MSIKEEQLTVKAVLLSSTADAPARCLMMDFVQFNCKYVVYPPEKHLQYRQQGTLIFTPTSLRVMKAMTS